MMEKVPVKTDNLDGVEIEINKNLTQFAAGHVCTEYEQSRKVTFSNVENNVYILRKRTAIIIATENSCSCGFFSSMGLPCRYIMAVRREKNLPIYLSSLARLRWTRSYYLSSHSVFKNMEPQGGLRIIPKQKTESDKYSETSKVTRNINLIMSTLPNDKYQYYLGKLKHFENLLTTDKLINVSEFLHDQNEDITEQPHNLLLIDTPNKIFTRFRENCCAK
ncbi:hypothetical protein X975_26886, partial [Stegodyphus mimosarum]